LSYKFAQINMISVSREPLSHETWTNFSCIFKYVHVKHACAAVYL